MGNIKSATFFLDNRIFKLKDNLESNLLIIKNTEQAEDRAEKILMLKEIYYGYKKQRFVLAMLRMFKLEEYNHSEFVSKLRQNVDKLLIEPNTTNGFLRIFEDIYNYRRQGKRS